MVPVLRARITYKSAFMGSIRRPLAGAKRYGCAAKRRLQTLNQAVTLSSRRLSNRPYRPNAIQVRNKCLPCLYHNGNGLELTNCNRTLFMQFEEEIVHKVNGIKMSQKPK